jgi:signal transduction histidine kinase
MAGNQGDLRKGHRAVRREIRVKPRRRKTLSSRKARQLTQLLQRLSTEFIDLPAQLFEAHIVGGLRQLVEALDVQRAAFAELDANGRYNVTHSYAVSGFDPIQPAVIDELRPWLDDTLRRGSMSPPADSTQRANAAKRARNDSVASEIKSNVTLPLSVGGVTTCVLAVGSRHSRAWVDDLIPYLKQSGEIFAAALKRKCLDEQFRRIEMQVAHLGRVSMMGQLVGSIAHEVNQPLCAIVSNAQAALGFYLSTPPEVDQATAAMKDIVRDGKRASEIISRTNTMLRRHPVNFTFEDMNELVISALPLVERYATLRHVRLELHLGNGIPRLMIDATQVQQVLINLIMNGVEAIQSQTNAQGLVRIETAYDHKSETVLVNVSDNGRGLSVIDRERIFEPFYTSKSQGMGMGLAISRAIVEAHGGRLWADSDAVRGASFSFAVPTRKESAHADQPAAGHSGG